MKPPQVLLTGTEEQLLRATPFTWVAAQNNTGHVGKRRTLALKSLQSSRLVSVQIKAADLAWVTATEAGETWLRAAR